MQQFAAPSVGWLAFELNVLRRLKFASAILPFAGEPHLGAYLKGWNVRVSANDLTQAGFIKAVAAIENNDEKLAAEEVALLLEDAYVPRYRLQNRSLANRFGETDAWWFDNVRAGVEKLSSHVKKAVALSVGISVGEYVFSFSEETRELRQPLSKVFERLVRTLPEPVNNNQENVCRNMTAKKFIAENYAADLMFLRLPPARGCGSSDGRNDSSRTMWREEWIRGDNGFWKDFSDAQAGSLGASTETKTQYLRFLEDILQTASHIPTWAIAHVENNFISAQDIAEIVARVRRVDTIYTKDFSEMTGSKAVIITA